MAAVVTGTGSSIGDAFRYDAYGETAASTTSALPTPWRYQGNLLLTEPGTSELYENGARAYDPALGAFTQLDSVTGSAQDPLSLNRFLYAWANPSTLTDPSGHCPGCGVWIDGEVATTAARHTIRSAPTTTRAELNKLRRNLARYRAHQRAVRYAAQQRARIQQHIEAARRARERASHAGNASGSRLHTRSMDIDEGRASPGRRPGPAQRARAAGIERARAIAVDRDLQETLGRLSVVARVHDDIKQRRDLHDALDLGGWLPLLGESADVANGMLYLSEGDAVNGALSLAGAVPILGWGASGLRLTARTVTAAMERAIRDHSKDVIVIGRRTDTAVAKDWPGHEILDLPRRQWSNSANDAWVRAAIDSKRIVYTALPPTFDNLWRRDLGLPTTFGRELDQFLKAGYRWNGDYLMPPSLP